MTRKDAVKQRRDAQAIVDFQKSQQQREALADAGQYDDPIDIKNKKALAEERNPTYTRPSEAPRPNTERTRTMWHR